MRHRLRFPYETSHQDVRIPVHGDLTLFARVWRPRTGEPVPALLEYSPERLTDTTVTRDAQRHPWYAGHGYASVRVEARGHGNSGGTPDPAGLPGGATALADAVDVIDWLAGQPWCTGRIGMFGLGWGGSCALATAARAPEPLKAVVAVCCGDDPHTNGGRYLGGAVLAESLHSASAALLSTGCRPPDPAHSGAPWRARWLERLETVEPAAHHWLAHQLRDDFWAAASPGPAAARPGPDLSAVRAAVLAVGGWWDPYRDTVLRLVGTLPPERVRGLIGPWSHQYPDHGRPGPAIGFLQETRRWWDRHLRGIENGVMDEPLLRTWSGDGTRGAGADGGSDDRPGPGAGRWTGTAAWPSPQVTPVAYELRGDPVPVASPQSTGLEAGPCRSTDGTTGGDQRADDACSACFEFPVAGEPVELLGTPRVTLLLRLGVPHGQAVARLCDVAPDGTSTRIALGALALSARHGTERAHAWPPGATEPVSFALAAAGHTFRPGHRIRLAVSSAYWPWLWPADDTAAGFVLVPEGSHLELPVRERRNGPSTAREPAPEREPEQAEPPLVGAAGTLEGERPARLLIREPGTGVHRSETVPVPGGTRVHPDGLEVTEEALQTWTIRAHDPLSAHALTVWRTRLHRPALPWDTTVETRSEIRCDADDFVLRDEVVCRDGREIVFHRTWEKRIPRLAG
ncbi:CocE/NonD family hydrolase [Streptomyces clavuligerus]|uniref:Peptidase S15 n=1 Tax=Streptomyces clavuligerus TaxID=1901 RepID=E2Q263_STRCL|nr:CocE/NonD family hydrolase [Streptomyces clavuligerus]ANW18682.1 peptidase S15 [Streptomyces clavuligerus]AXU13248.1 CocE/NonD family hydrolase [Streptomyces clavuligerus]EFG08651.1 Peptidase S15 [Streptomyces clavuligerus]MBY6303196.1 CocE/NonD family hydrolase [Streptomyces clavuligerus]QCS06031.1 peptidase S15 [Streptomyces clavuligerus]